MSIGAAPSVVESDVPEARSARTGVVIARRAFKQVWIGATVCTLGFGATVAATASSYVSTFPTQASRLAIAASTRSDTGLATLLGPTSAVGTVGGYTVYKLFVTLTTIGAIWALLAGTRLLRGEEDAGRWQLVLAGNTRPPEATVATLGALEAAVGVMFVGTTVFTVLVGRDHRVGFGVGDSVLYGLSIVVAPAVFAAVGAVTSQLPRTRRLATGLGMGVFGLAFVLRMIADSGPGARWLLWWTPFGWSQLTQPFTENDAWPLLPAGLVVLVLGGVAVALASRRDVGDGLLASSDVSPIRPFGLRSAFGLTARLELPVIAVWCAGAAAAAFTMGVIAEFTTSDVPSGLRHTLDRFGVHGALLSQYFGVAFLLVATVVALLPAGQIAAASDEETSRRLVQVLARPPSRAGWFAGRLLLTAGGVVVAGLVAGLAAWLGALSQGVDPGFTAMAGAGLNVIPTALVALGIGAVALAVAPRAAGGIVYVVIIWSVVADLTTSIVPRLRWVDHLSVFHYMALAPAQAAEPRTLAITVVVAIGLGIVATLLFRRRDLPAG